MFSSHAKNVQRGAKNAAGQQLSLSSFFSKPSSVVSPAASRSDDVHGTVPCLEASPIARAADSHRLEPADSPTPSLPSSPERRTYVVTAQPASSLNLASGASDTVRQKVSKYCRAPGKQMCSFGRTCYRKNPKHFEEEDHPADHPFLCTPADEADEQPPLPKRARSYETVAVLWTAAPSAAAGAGALAANAFSLAEVPEARVTPSLAKPVDEDETDEDDHGSGEPANAKQPRGIGAWEEPTDDDSLMAFDMDATIAVHHVNHPRGLNPLASKTRRTHLPSRTRQLCCQLSFPLWLSGECGIFVQRCPQWHGRHKHVYTHVCRRCFRVLEHPPRSELTIQQE